MIAQASPAAGPLRADPSKRVNYTLGLVLGVDEFQQDQLYHAAGRRGHNRLLHGYGTVWGLRVAAALEGGDPEIQVDAGVALDPHGREIRVPDRMCVKLTRWLDRHRPVLRDFYGLEEGEAPPTLPLAVVLCHRECATDAVPVPGEPCRTQEDAMAPSRLQDGFELKLALRDDAPWGSPPASAPTGLAVFRLSQPEEQAVRAFGLLMARVQSATDEALGTDGEETLREGIRALARAADEGTLASPPAPDDDPILLPAAEAPEILRRALGLWVTEVRPALRALENPGTCGDSGDGECCVLLAELDLEVTADWAVVAEQAPLREDLRPYLLHTRLLQEWLIASGGGEGRPDVDTFASLQILGPNRIRVWLHHAEWLDLPREALTVLVNDVPLPPAQVLEVPYGNVRNVWDIVVAQELNDGNVVEVRFDTEAVPLVHPPVAPAGEELLVDLELDAGPRRRGAERVYAFDGTWLPSTAERTGATIADELRAPSGEYLDRYGRYLSAFTVYDRIQGGDLADEYQLPTVVKIQKFPVDPATPLADQYLVSDGAKWLPRLLPEGEKDLEFRYPNSIVRGIQDVPVSSTKPVEKQYLYFNGKNWVPAHLPDGETDLDGVYPNCTVVRLQNTEVSNAKPGKDQYLYFDQPTGRWIPANLPDAEEDLSGKYPRLSIAKLQKKEVAAADPSENEALAFVGGKWVPAGIPALLGAAGGDLSGAYPDPSVVRLRGRPLAETAPGEGDVLVYREAGSPPEGEWVPQAIAFAEDSDLGGTYPQIRVERLQGHAVDAGEPAAGQVLRFEESSPPGAGRWVPADLPPDGATGAAGGDLGGEYPAPRIAALQGRTLAAEDPADGQVLRFQESSPPGNGRWGPVDLPPAGATGEAGGDLGGEYPAPRIAALQGRTVAAEDPADGQVLRFQESSPPGNGRWVAVDPPGGGTAGAAGGDLGGEYPDPRVLAIRGVPVADVAPAPGQVLRFEASTASPPEPGRWVPADPPQGGASGAAGGDLTGEYPAPRLQALQDVPLFARNPVQGQSLAFDGKAWSPRFAVGAAGGEYAIVAAGRFIVRFDQCEPLSTPYNGLKLDFFDFRSYTLQLTGFPYSPKTHEYIVKGTWEGGVVLAAGEGDQGPVIRLFQLDVENARGELHLEVSAFPLPAQESIREPITEIGTPRVARTEKTAPTDSTPQTTTKRTTRKRPPTG